MQSSLTATDIRKAAEVGRAHGVKVTPVMTCESISERSSVPGGVELYFKCECLQKTGSFKFRGAMNAVQNLREGAKGVVTHSSGNHGQALAAAAASMGLKSTVVVPNNAPKIKRAAVAGYGAEIVDCEPTQAAREAAALKVETESGYEFIHPYNDFRVMAGQGTIALELLEQVPDLDAIIVPIGGGGMMSGVATMAKDINPNIRIFGAEPLAANDAKRSLESGNYQTNASPPQTVADGLKTNLGDRTWPIIQKNVEAIVAVDDDAIKVAMKLVWERLKLCIEPSAGVGVAVALSDEFAQKAVGCKKVGIVLCGGNVDLDTWTW